VRELVQPRERGLRLRNKMTEKDYNPEQRNAKLIKKQDIEKKNLVTAPIEKKVNEGREKPKEKAEASKEEKKKQKPKVPKVKKTEAILNASSLPISTKKATDICRFIRGKKIQKAISELEKILAHKRALPMKGEIPHQKGMNIASGGYPKKAIEHFVKLLKGLQANANANGLDGPFISLAMANLASRPYGRFGRVRKKRTHVKLIAKEKSKKGVKR